MTKLCHSGSHADTDHPTTPGLFPTTPPHRPPPPPPPPCRALLPRRQELHLFFLVFPRHRWSYVDMDAKETNL
ncbi:hypothetical protein E2C01_054673 [Portunus trituberculatus]|uniref:Uncharacterized protein n=1 Tax=Portunus trituberculatus TaxID=210409 RepID=A0A5B7GKA5_PORTR|nr:hypothetical protein [Portunus trituberculatus]